MKKAELKKLFIIIFMIILVYLEIRNFVLENNEMVSKETIFRGVTAEETAIETSLIENGYPKSVLQYMSWESKQEAYDEELIFASATVTYYDFDAKTSNAVELVSDESAESLSEEKAAGDDLELVFIFGAKVDQKENLECVAVEYCYNWLTFPGFRLQDPISISWDSELFEMKADDFHKVDMYDGLEFCGFRRGWERVTEQIHSDESGYADASPAGVKWYADLKGYAGAISTKWYGYGVFKLEPQADSYDGEVNLYGNYVHATTVDSVEFAASSVGTIRFPECTEGK